MIHVDIVVPFQHDILEVACDENVLTESLMEIIMQKLKETEGLDSYASRLTWLCHIENRKIVVHNRTIMDSGISNGSSLVLI